MAKYLFSNYGLALFLEGIINKVDLESVPEDFFKFICTRGGFIALFIEKLIVFEDIVLLDFSHLQWLFSEHGLQALREQLIPIEQLVLLTPSHLEFLLTPNGLSALREGLMTIQGSRYLVKDFGTSKSPKSTRQRAKYFGRDCPASGTLR